MSQLMIWCGPRCGGSAFAVSHAHTQLVVNGWERSGGKSSTSPKQAIKAGRLPKCFMNYEIMNIVAILLLNNNIISLDNGAIMLSSTLKLTGVWAEQAGPRQECSPSHIIHTAPTPDGMQPQLWTGGKQSNVAITATREPDNNYWWQGRFCSMIHSTHITHPCNTTSQTCWLVQAEQLGQVSSSRRGQSLGILYLSSPGKSTDH